MTQVRLESNKYMCVSNTGKNKVLIALDGHVGKLVVILISDYSDRYVKLATYSILTYYVINYKNQTGIIPIKIVVKLIDDYSY
jgi:hypothetical protein